MHHPQLTRLTLGFASCLLLLACGDDKHSESAEIAGKLRECDLVSDGKINPAVPDYQLTHCQAACVADATCEELEKLYCGANPSARLRDCQAACLAPKCDGGKRQYTLLDRCDGDEKCEDGADEADCPVIDDKAPKYCEDSGDRITFLTRCNGAKDCKDGTDEKNCPEEPETFTCDTKLGTLVQQVPASKMCDTIRDCADGSDESTDHGCAEICPDN